MEKNYKDKIQDKQDDELIRIIKENGDSVREIITRIIKINSDSVNFFEKQIISDLNYTKKDIPEDKLIGKISFLESNIIINLIINSCCDRKDIFEMLDRQIKLYGEEDLQKVKEQKKKDYINFFYKN